MSNFIAERTMHTVDTSLPCGQTVVIDKATKCPKTKKECVCGGCGWDKGKKLCAKIVTGAPTPAPATAMLALDTEVPPAVETDKDWVAASDETSLPMTLIAEKDMHKEPLPPTDPMHCTPSERGGRRLDLAR
jgi:hypothetical protein